MNKIIIIAGPTGSGKTKVSVEIAKQLNGEIVSADSMQIYKKFDVGTAKVTADEMQGIPHHLIDVVDGNEEFSVAEYTAQANRAIADIIARGKLPIIVGGTGFYINSILYKKSFGKTDSNEEVRAKYEQLLKEHGATYIHDILKSVDPESAEKLHQNDTNRVIRAIEIFEVTGKKKSDQKDENIPLFDAKFYCLDTNRELLYSRINSRVDAMFDNALLTEVTELHKVTNREAQSFKAIGYREFLPYFDGETTLDVVLEKIKQNTRNYAKRQLTWFRHQADCTMVDTSVGLDKVVEMIVQENC